MAERSQGNPIGDEWDSGNYDSFFNQGLSAMDPRFDHELRRYRTSLNDKPGLRERIKQIIESVGSKLRVRK
ncbi:hypothetical protein A2394_01170 [Candidatus Woesebacteria bacterium RIFOXYB1_FULL_42_36]|uniref:Uncharacterized protein n=1 Tax=Candidatus Woesebacteria bacterium RIFOXYD1_FULL_43_18 TaxID=1802551 RepID=A0A1F8DKW1_9BACT|nr:MAG: hypothetical protein A2208_02525 [Candidatus Woesebacteria bacterium RIFOXYA1_FULL_43_16]OGM81387.1 MAG: hypothetical protein A2394_01170 [Candidatus Woesebacteria bacterium RIFOXYB1_FULL_42_36]OGM83572.1 MAG: hypothetical protein A2421_01000 [Candidatus Woesebacteria bacterium RIFOXYC1_FULL_43_18]OGM88508.1 MAG: hypothetical protein A2573_02860 [Candidatus Woesebacteria bacterium RIFOXYD1_FULL_43_18]